MKNVLSTEDITLFQQMEHAYISDNERVFFTEMRNKMENEIAPSNDLLIFELDNSDNIYLLRCVYDEFIIGHGIEGCYDEEFHTMNLHDALFCDLCEIGFLTENITLLDWLRKRDYQGVRYNHNYSML